MAEERKERTDGIQAYEDEDLSRLFRNHPDFVVLETVAAALHCHRRDLKKRCAAIGKPLRLAPRTGLTRLQLDICLEAQRAWEGARLEKSAYLDSPESREKRRRARRLRRS